MYKYFFEGFNFSSLDCQQRHIQVTSMFPCKKVRYLKSPRGLTALSDQLPNNGYSGSMTVIPLRPKGSKVKFITTLNIERSTCTSSGARKREAIKDIRSILDEFDRMAIRNGFCAEINNMSRAYTISGQKLNFNLVFNAVDFEGTLIVQDPVLFKNVEESGMGSGKAYGMGLINVL